MVLLLLAACASSDPADTAARSPRPNDDTAVDTDVEADTDTDSDADADSDADTDADSDSDTDTDTDTETGGGDTPADAYAEGDGPWAVSTTTSAIGGTDVTWYIPRGGTDRPVVIWTHGFARSAENHATAARRAASWGFLVAAPSLSAFDSHAENADFVAGELLSAALDRSEAGEQVAFVGHSAGGLVSMLAAAQVESAAWVGLDAVDDTSGQGEDAARSVRAPALFLDGEPSSCNADGNNAGWRTAGDSWRVDVVDATHCDFESDSDGLCEALCGGTDADRQELIVTYAIAWLIHETEGGADAWVRGSQAEADRAAGRIDW